MAQPRVFVSHSHLDDAFAERLVKDLKSAGADAWLDKEDLGAGDFQERISEALDKCEWFVLVLTENAIASPWVTQEVHAANRLKHQKRIRDLILVKAEPVEPRSIPALWGVYNIFDATYDYKVALDKTVGAIGILPSAGTVAFDRVAVEIRNVFPIAIGPGIWFDTVRNTVRVNGITVRLTPTESRILQLLAANPGEVCTLNQIVEHAWGYGDDGDTYLIKAHIRHLREKIEIDPNNPRYIITAPDGGCIWRPLGTDPNPD